MDSRNRRNQTDIYTKEQIKRVLTGTGVDIQSEIDSDYIIYCPFHNNHRTPAGEVHKDNGLFFCFSCQKTADLIELVMHTSGRSYFESMRFIKSKEQQTSLEQEINKKLIVKPDYVQFDELTIKRLNNQALSSPRAVQYFKSRFLTNESAIKFSLGYSEKQDMVTIPVHSPEGIPVGFVGRSIEGKDFKNTPGLPKSKVLFNLHRVKKSDKVYVVESSFDVIRLDQVGFPAVATLGANVSNSQVDLLKRYFNDIIIIADNDEAGGNMKDRIVERLGSRVSVIQLDKKYKDIGDMNDSDIINLQSNFYNSMTSILGE
jgi:DNA primase